MESNLQAGIKMKQILQLTALSTAIALAGCGGGGGGGFYGPSGSTTPTGTGTGTGTTAATATNYHLVMTSSKTTMLVTGDTATVTVSLVDAAGGGVAAQNVTLSIPDTINNGVRISGASTVVTDATGSATFTINMPAESGTVASGLIANGLKLGASFTDATGKVTLQTTLITVIPTPATVGSPATLDRLVMASSKSTLSATGDSATLTVKLLDPNGGGVAGQPVVLSIPNAIAQGLSIRGSSQGTTDTSGNAVFIVDLSGSGTPSSSVTINAKFTDSSNVSTSQTTSLNVVAPLTAPSPATLDHLVISSTKTTLVTTGDTATVTVKLADANGGAVSGQNVVLSLPAAVIAEGVTLTGASSVVTDVNGNAIFTVSLVGTTGANATALIASGINLRASFTDSSGVSTSQTTTLGVIAPPPPVTTPLYHLVMSSSKPTIAVTGDTTTVTVKAVDVNGGAVAGQTVVLSIPNSVAQGVTVRGSSTAVTDQFGNASFTLNLVTAGTTINLATLAASGIEVDAAITDANGNTARQATTLNLFAVPVPNITFGNNSKEATSSDGTFYYENLAVNVVDANGNPMVGQPITLSIKLNGFAKGSLNYILDPSNSANSSANQWYPYTVQDVVIVTPAVPANPTATPPTPAIPAVTAPNTPTTTTPGVAPFTYSPTAIACAFTSQSFVQNAVTFVQATGTPATSSPSSTVITSPTSGDSSTTYVTDNSGAFALQLRYLRRYAFWQNVTITASTTFNGTTVSSVLPYSLQPTISDLQTQGGQPYAPRSPYGVSTSSTDCGNAN